jgi:adenylate cyclase
MSQQRQLAAILFTDIVGYTGLMQENEQKAVALIKHYNAAVETTVATHEGKVLNYYGDGSLCSFPSVIEAVNCAIDLQNELRTAPAVPLRIGLHIGEIIFENGKALGDGVNIASRIQSLGQANTILFSKEIFDKVRNHPEFTAVSIGKFDFKNVEEPVEVFALANEGLMVPKREQMSGNLKLDPSGKKKTIRENFTIAASVLILLLGAIFLYIKYFSKKNSPVEKSIAVLPFINMSNDAQQEYFAQGMMDEILNHLYKIGGLNVISRTSSMAYKDSKKTSKEIANELGVGNLLEGSVQKDGDHIRIIVQLISGKTDDHLWAETYVREFKDVFAVQSDIAQQVASALKVKIDPGTKSRIEYIPTTNTSSYNLYLLARKKELQDEWKELLEKVIQSDSSFAPAYADLGFYWLLRGGFWGDLNAKQVLDSALPFLQKAVTLDSNLASVHNYFAQVHLWYQWDFKAAEKEWKKFFQLNPSGTVWADNYHDFLEASGRFTEALNFSLKNFEQDKTQWGYLVDASTDYFYLGYPEKAQAILDSLLSVGKELYLRQAWLSLWLGKYQQVLDNLNKYFEKNPNAIKLTRAQAWLGICYFYTGRPDETQKILDSLQARSKKSPVGSPAFHIAMIYSATNRTELALQWLEKAYEDHETEIYWLKVEPLFNPLRNDARFKELLKKMGFK